MSDNKSILSLTSTKSKKCVDKHCQDGVCNGKRISGKNWGDHKKRAGHPKDGKFDPCTGEGCQLCLNI